MSKFFQHFFSAALLTTSIAQFTLPSGANNITMVNAQTFQVDEPLCFIKTSDGKVRDLASMCGYQNPDICNFPIHLEPEQASSLNDFCNKNQKCSLTNNCNQTPFPNYSLDE
jgi:hypothetical protein